MRVNVKFLNGDLLSLNMETYSEQNVRKELYASGEHTHAFKLIEVEKDEKDEKEKDEKEKDILVVFLPVHKRGKEFVTMLNQYARYTYEPHYLIDGSLFTQWVDECRNCASEQGYESFIKKKSELYYYFSQLPLFLSYSDDDGNICGDTYVTADETALQFFTNVIVKCHEDVIQDRICLNIYKQLCVTSQTSQSLTNIASQLYSLDHLVNFTNREGDIEDVLTGNSFMIRGKLLQIIHSVKPIVIFETIDEISSDELISTFSSVSRLTYTKVLGVLKYYMHIM